MRWSIEKRKRATTVLISCFLGLIATVTGAETPGDRWSAESIVSPWVEMWNAYDLDMVDKLFVIDDRVTYLSSEKEGTIVGIEAVREHHRGFGFISGGVARETSLWVDQLHETVLGNTVVVTGFWYFKRADGSTQRGPMTFVYFLEDEEWRLVHVHFANYLSDALD